MDRVIDKRDAMRQKQFPTLMKPIYGELPPLEMHKSRLVMAREGLYIQANQPWGSITRKIYDAPKSLPYGDLEEKDQLVPVLENEIMPIVRELMLPEAAQYAAKGKEWQGLVVFDNGEFKYHSDQFNNAGGSVKYHVPDLIDTIVADVHSHHTMRPFWSSTDNADDNGQIKIAMVLGSYDPAHKPVFDMKLRYCISGFFFDYDEPSEEEMLTDFIREIKVQMGSAQ